MITDLRLQNFRSYEDSSFELSPGVNIIVGPNASGKTNLLEAVLVLARGSSYRVRDHDLVRIGSPWSRLDADSNDNQRRTIKIVSGAVPSKDYEIEGKKYKRLTLNNSLPVVLFEPTHLQLFSGGPEKRRDYIDDLLEQTVPGFGVTRRQYKRTLAQRNSLLKNSSHPDPKQFFPWNVRLSQLAGQIVRQRQLLAGAIDAEITELYKKISKTNTSVKVSYDSRWPVDSYESRFLSRLEHGLDDDKLRGFTSSGPHREDLLVAFDDHPAQEVASRGEVRTAVLALKIIELKIIEKSRDKTPLLLLDDVFSELDGARRHALTDYLKNYQTFITTTDADLVIQNFTSECNVIALG